jgi:hypothetical protein
LDEEGPLLARLLNSAYGGFLALTARSWPTGNACSGWIPAVWPADGRGAKRKIQGEPRTADAMSAGGGFAD